MPGKQVDWVMENAPDQVEFSSEHLDEIFIAPVPFNTELGLKVVSVSPGSAVIKLPFSNVLIGNPETGVLHGGAVTALIDATCGIAVYTRLDRAARVATLDLRIDYLRGAKPGEPLFARAQCDRITRNVAFVRASAFQQNEREPVASAAGTFILVGD